MFINCVCHNSVKPAGGVFWGGTRFVHEKGEKEYGYEEKAGPSYAL